MFRSDPGSGRDPQTDLGLAFLQRLLYQIGGNGNSCRVEQFGRFVQRIAVDERHLIIESEGARVSYSACAAPIRIDDRKPPRFADRAGQRAPSFIGKRVTRFGVEAGQILGAMIQRVLRIRKEEEAAHSE